MHWSVYLFGALALGAAHLLRAPKGGRLLASMAAFLIGLAVTAIAIRALAGAAGLGRTTEFDGFVNRAIEIAKQDDGPLIVFTGASFSRNAIDDDRLTLALRERGYPHRAISLSLEAASILERDAHLQDFLARSPRAPDVVFVEVAKEFDHRPAFFFGNSKFSTRGIEQFDPATTLWTAYGLADGQCDGLKGCVVDTAMLGAHAGLNWLNVGLLSKGEKTADARPEPSYSALTDVRQEMDQAALGEDLMTDATISPLSGPQWVKSYRTAQRERLLGEDGVRLVGYYLPPVTQPENRNYVSGLCAGELVSFPCIAPDDPALLAALPPALWADPEHLMDDGAAIYIGWLADQLELSGILEGAEQVGALRGHLGPQEAAQ